MKLKNLTLDQLEEMQKEIDKEIEQVKRAMELEKCGHFKEEIAIWGPSFGEDELDEIVDPLEKNFLRWFLKTKVNHNIDLEKYFMIYKVADSSIKEDHRDISVYGFFDVNPMVASAGVKYPTIQIGLKGREYLLQEYVKYKFV
ncbi:MULTISPECIES: hypothetical protein [Paenibacillus]|uniref:Uncharacterized protein n=2 Tax=Paenibacillus TaxID=44249 RepID=A0ABX2ZEX3_PAEPO|nr:MULTISPECIES: hypothetical protein [Paenibacillus]MDR6779521.1 hypothetical protein [Paenibacillus peoriae]ODA09111.1 hypothetical protein A7312_27215 [Paenibacillus polymyxa]